MFKSVEEIASEIEHIKDALFKYDIENAEAFSRQVSEMQDRGEVQELKRVLVDARNLYNTIRLQGEYDFLDQVDFKKLNMLLRDVSDHLDLLNQKEALENQTDTSGLLNIALEDIIFTFRKLKEEELVIADKLKNALRQTRESLGSNFDPKDPKFITLKEELQSLFNKKNLSEISQDEMVKHIDLLKQIHEKAKKLNHENELLRSKYKGDKKYARIHKRLVAKDGAPKPSKLHEALMGVKEQLDEQVLLNTQLLDNESYFARMTTPMVIGAFKTKGGVALNAEGTKAANDLITAEYLAEFSAEAA